MPLWETLTGWIDHDRSQLAYLHIDPEHADRRIDPQSIEAGVHYIRLRLASMFLRKETSWFKDWHPAVHSTVRFTFGNRELDLPGIADSTRIGLQQTGGGDFVARNFMLTPTIPFHGGTVSLNAGLLALEGKNHLKSFLKTLGNFSGLLGVAQLSAALNIVQPLAEGIQELFTAGGSRLHLGLYDSFAAGELKAGYLAAIRVPEKSIRASRLWVIGDALHEGDTLEQARLKPLEQYDHMLMRVEVFDRRDDWEHLVSIQEPFQEALRALRDPQTADQAAQHMRTALLRAIESPELTGTDKRRVVERLKEKYEYSKQTLNFSNALGDDIPTLKQVMRGPMSLASAKGLGEPTVAEVFRLIPSEASRMLEHFESPGDDIVDGKDSAESGHGLENQPAPVAAPVDVPVDASPTFNFALEGNGTRRNQVVYGAEFKLVFDYGQAVADTLASVRGDVLDKEVEKGEFDLDLTIIPKGFIFTDSVHRRTAKFLGGKLEGEVVFNLRASSEPVADSGLHVIFEVRGNVVYEFYLPVRLVHTPDEAEAQATPQLDLKLDDITAARAREPREVRLNIFAEGDNLSINYDNLGTDVSFSVKPRIVTLSYLADALSEIKAYLEPVPTHQIWDVMKEPLAAPTGDRAIAALLDCTKRVVTAGWALYQKLIVDEDFRKILDEIFRLEAGSRLSIKTDCAFIPWEILYPEEYNVGWPDELQAQHPMQPQKLLGSVLNIECLLAGWNKNYKTPATLHESSPPFVSFNLFRNIDEGFEKGKDFLPGASHEELSGTLSAAGVRTELWKSGDDIRKNVIHKNRHDATLIYFFCHGQNDKPLDPQQREKLEIDTGQFITPLDVPRSFVFPHGPLVFLNSCSSAAISPHSFSNFLSVFREKQAVGLIATSFPVPIRFGAAFGQEFIRRYMRDKQSVGDALLDMRRDLLGKGNPLGLFYSIQCPMDIKIHTR